MAARIGLAELLLSGTTTAADHHYLFAESYRFDPAHVIFEVAEELGLRLVFCRGGATKGRTFDTPGIIPIPTEPLDRMIKSVEVCAQRYHDPSPGSMRRVVFAPTNPPYSVEPAELRAIVAAARHMGLRIHGHLSECAADVDHCLAAFGKRPVAWMAEHDCARSRRLVRPSGSRRRPGDRAAGRNRHRHRALPAIELPARLRHCASGKDGGARRRRLARGRWRRLERGRRHGQRNAQRVARPSRRQGSGRREHRGDRALGERRRRPRARVRRPRRAGAGQARRHGDLRSRPIRATADCTTRCRDLSPPPAPRSFATSWSEVASSSRTAAFPGSISQGCATTHRAWSLGWRPDQDAIEHSLTIAVSRSPSKGAENAAQSERVGELHRILDKFDLLCFSTDEC